MNMSPASRLKKTWNKVKTAKLFILEISTVVGSQVRPAFPRDSAQLRPCLLPAPDGSNREFLQLQDSPVRDRPPLPVCPQQQEQVGQRLAWSSRLLPALDHLGPGGLHQRTLALL